jgi:outer membrane protein assembly factor BamB
VKPSTLPRLAIASLLLALLLPGREAEAVIPSAFGPIQALLVILPQLLVALAAAAVALLKPRTYKLLFAYLWAHKILSTTLVAGVTLLAWGPWRTASAGPVTAEQAGAPWAAFRGGPLRTGAVAGAKGPLERPVPRWKEGFGGSANVDSSPAVVGNRVYVGLGSAGFGGARGEIACLDAGTGAVVWTWDGKGELDPPLKPVFSSPAVSVDPARLVIGEGYHEDRDCRLLCLDLEPAKKPGGKPKLAWALQTTSHVESTPCIHEGRAIIGAGDDGVWCVDLSNGKVLWRVDGDPAYAVAEGPKANALAALEGKSVTATGRVRREGVGAKGKDDAGTSVIEIRDFRECAGAPVTSSEPGPERSVTGKVVRKGGRILLEVPWHNPDSESCPIGVGPYVLFGSGIGGQRVNCVEAATGKLVWQAPTPYPAFGPPTVAGDRVLIGVGNGNFLASAEKPAGAVLCFSLKDGSHLWRVDAADTILGAVAVDGLRGYACGRDGQVYVIDLEKGEVASKLAVGSPMVCSPALTADAVYATTGAGRLLCLDRKGGAVRWSFTLSADEQVFSSPSVANGGVYVGTRGKGLFCLAERAADPALAGPPRPWMGAGGNPSRNGAADDRGLPTFEGDTADLKWPTPEGLQAPVLRPPLACGHSVYAAFENRLVKIDAVSGRIAAEFEGKTYPYAAGPDHVHAWNLADGPVPDGRGFAKFEPPALWPPARGDFDNNPRSHRFRLRDPVFAHDLIVEASGFDLECVSAMGPVLWNSRLRFARSRPPALLDDKVFVATETVDEPVKASLECRRLVDGSPVWQAPLNARAASHPVAHGDWVVIATSDDKIAVFNAADGKGIEPVVIDGKAATPALWKNTLIVAGGTRIAAYDLSTRDWIWNYKGQDDIGMVVGQPVISHETIWVGTTKKGLLAIGVPPKAAKK